MFDNDSHQKLLSEALRPKLLSELAISSKTISALEIFIKRGSIPNLLFYGDPGAGKTSAAKIIASRFDTYVINGSDQRKERSTISAIEQFASTVSMCGLPKVCLIDEGDYLPKESQAVLRGLIESLSSHCRFIVTANNRNKLSDAIQSRLTAIQFSVPIVERNAIIERYTTSLHEKLISLKYQVDRDWLKSRVLLRFPDFRSIANDVELNATNFN